MSSKLKFSFKNNSFKKLKKGFRKMSSDASGTLSARQVTIIKVSYMDDDGNVHSMARRETTQNGQR